MSPTNPPRTKTPRKRIYKRRTPPVLPPLPQLAKPPRDSQNILTITTIQVYDKPWYRGGAGTQWITAMKPSKPVGEGDIVRLEANLDRRTGVGRISHVTSLDKHWVTFRIAGAVPKSNIRVPLPWARLHARVAATHARNYLTLENIPPHSAFRDDAQFRNPHINPYRTEEASHRRQMTGSSLNGTPHCSVSPDGAPVGMSSRTSAHVHGESAQETGGKQY